MAPSEMKDQTVKQLSDIRKAMSEPEYQLGVKKLPPEKQKEYAISLQLVQQTLTQMRNSELSAITDKLVAHEAELNTGTTRIQHVLSDLKKTEEIMAEVALFLKIVGKIVAMV